MLHTAAADPPQRRILVFAVDKSPGEVLTISRAVRFSRRGSVCQLHAIHEPIVLYLGVAEEIVKSGGVDLTAILKIEDREPRMSPARMKSAIRLTVAVARPRRQAAVPAKAGYGSRQLLNLTP
jgi:hypothetical protein